MGVFTHHEACEECGSSDGKAVYEDESSYCFVCQHSTIGNNTDPKPKKVKKPNKMEKAHKTITPEQHQEIKNSAGFQAFSFRGISDETLKFFGCRTSLTEDNDVVERFYPVTRGGNIAGYKVRTVPKTFRVIGDNGSGVDLYGSHRFQQGGKYILIVGGEEDAHAAYQMFSDYARSKGGDFVTAVVSVTTGETSAAKQIAANYAFLSKFDTIVIGFDADEPGRKGAESIISSLPKGDIRICTWTKGKDPNDILEKNLARTFISDFYNAKTYVPAGVVGSDQLYNMVVEQAYVEKVPLPPFMTKLSKMLYGGLTLGHIVNIAAMTSVGKTTFVNELVHFLVFNSPHMVGVVSLELNAGQYGEAMLSRHMHQKLARLSPTEKLANLASESTIKAADELFKKEDGTPRFYLVDDRDGTLEQIQEVIEQMIVASGVKVIVIDPLQDLLESLSNEDQALFMKWTKSMIKSHNCLFILINHTRKKSGDNADNIQITESDVMGSSVITKSATVNILLARDKNAVDDIERNTTYVTLPKNRMFGETGPAGKIYYDNQTHTLHDYETFFSSEIPQQPTEEVPSTEDQRPEPPVEEIKHDF